METRRRHTAMAGAKKPTGVSRAPFMNPARKSRITDSVLVFASEVHIDVTCGNQGNQADHERNDEHGLHSILQDNQLTS